MKGQFSIQMTHYECVAFNATALQGVGNHDTICELPWIENNRGMVSHRSYTVLDSSRLVSIQGYIALSTLLFGHHNCRHLEIMWYTDRQVKHVEKYCKDSRARTNSFLNAMLTIMCLHGFLFFIIYELSWLVGKYSGVVSRQLLYGIEFKGFLLS